MRICRKYENAKFHGTHVTWKTMWNIYPWRYKIEKKKHINFHENPEFRDDL